MRTIIALAYGLALALTLAACSLSPEQEAAWLRGAAAMNASRPAVPAYQPMNCFRTSVGIHC